jgi:hypothetical protein
MERSKVASIALYRDLRQALEDTGDIFIPQKIRISEDFAS